ncbi:MAG: phage gp6-like head-tail connector protein [Candidatus Omnitrophica bacterium]|nr:phage gp6-like head-tail connector protein [Candidatus Omnitrophota bacterium]
MSIKIITQPEEILTVSEVADFLRIDFPDEETTEIQNMITAARLWCEEYLQRSIGIQTLETILGAFPTIGRQEIKLFPPVISVTSVKYLDTNNDEQTLVVGTDFYSSVDSEPGEVVPVSAWPVSLDVANSVRVRYTTGYSDPGNSPLLSTALPSSIRLAMLMQIGDLYENREAQTTHTLTANPTIERLVSVYRLGMGI